MGARSKGRADGRARVKAAGVRIGGGTLTPGTRVRASDRTYRVGLDGAYRREE